MRKIFFALLLALVVLGVLAQFSPHTRQAFPVAALREVSGLFRSPFKRMVFEVSGGRLYKELTPYFGPKGSKTKTTPEPFTIDVVPRKLRELDLALSGNGFPDLKLRQKGGFHAWRAARQAIAAEAGVQPDDISDWVVFLDQGQFLFAGKAEGYVPVELRVLSEGDERVIPFSVLDKMALPDLKSDLERELAFRDFARRRGGAFRLRKMTPATNDMRYPRDAVFDWDGEMISALRNKGGRSLPRLQELLRAALREGVIVEESGEIRSHAHTTAALRRAYDIAPPGGRGDFQTEFGRARERAVFHEFAFRWLGNKEALVRSFLKSKVFEKYSPQFIDAHIGGIGATGFDVARAMLAGILLFEFEKNLQGVASVEESYSQGALARVTGYHETLHEWVQAQLGKAGEAKDIRTLLAGLGGAEPFTASGAKDARLDELVSSAERSFPNLQGQVSRRATHDRLTWLLGAIGWITDHRRSFPNNFIANVGLGKARVSGAGTEEKYVFTLAAFLDPARVDGYLGPDRLGFRELPGFQPDRSQLSDQDVGRFIREILSASDFMTYRDLIEKYAPQLSGVLLREDYSPAAVRKFASVLYGDGLAEILFPKTSVHDPNSISRFYPESFSEFEKMARYRIVFDLAHGVTTELVRRKQGKWAHLRRVFGGQWRAYSFWDLSDGELIEALKSVLEGGDRRLRKLAQEPVKEMSVVDWREELEVWLGWDTYDMTFLRHYRSSDEWESLGAGWSCVCFIRKTIFNADVLRQF